LGGRKDIRLVKTRSTNPESLPEQVELGGGPNGEPANPELSVGWVNLPVGLGWLGFGSVGSVSWWVGLGWVKENGPTG